METVEWVDSGAVRMVDQTLLPLKVKYITLRNVDGVVEAIRMLRVRGAPAIGVTAAMGMALGAIKFRGKDKEKFLKHMDEVADTIAAARPTAVNLFWAVERQKAKIEKMKKQPVERIQAALVAEGKKTRLEDIRINKRMGANGAKLVPKGAGILTHCNAGALATAGYGTALGVIRAAAARGLVGRVYADETRPLLQGARITALEMVEEKIPATLITDNMAGYLMAQGRVDCVIVGADRIASNGDVANKIGTYSVAVLARAHGVPFYVAAPISTIDYNIRSGRDIPIEQRDPDEVRIIGERQMSPRGMPVWNPAFDVTPARLVSAIITEGGVCRKPYRKSLRALLG